MRKALAMTLLLTLSMTPAHALGTFPTVTSDDLNGDSKTLPGDLPGDPTIVFIAYKQGQQNDVNSWVYGMGLDPSQGIDFVEIPIVGRAARLMKSVVDNGMRGGITDPNMRARTITLYESVNLLNSPLGFSGKDQIRVLLVRPNGEVLWSTSGPATPKGIEDLRALFEANK